jgi:hypothetical protein
MFVSVLQEQCGILMSKPAKHVPLKLNFVSRVPAHNQTITIVENASQIFIE